MVKGTKCIPKLLLSIIASVVLALTMCGTTMQFVYADDIETGGADVVDGNGVQTEEQYTDETVPNDQEVTNEGDEQGEEEMERLGEPEETYNLWVGGTQVTSDNCENIPAAEGYEEYSGKASYDPKTKTLTLDNYKYKGPGLPFKAPLNTYNAAIYSDDDLTIELKGNSSITNSAIDNNSAVIFTNYNNGNINLVITDNLEDSSIGRLSLDAKCTGKHQSTGVLFCGSKFKITGGMVNVNVSDTYYSHNGIFSTRGDIDITGGSLTATAQKPAGTESWINSMGIRIDNDKVLTIGKNAGEVIASGYTQAIYGNVINKKPGKGWTNAAGTEGEEAINYSDTARELKTANNGNFLKVHFDPTAYDLWVGGTQVTSSNCKNIPAAEGYEEYSGKASYDPETKTLTLDNYKYKGPGVLAQNGQKAAIYTFENTSSDIITIKLKGSSSVTMADSILKADGIYVRNARLKIEDDPDSIGTGSLEVKAISGKGTGHTRGINVVDASLYITSGIVNATGGKTKYNAQGLKVENGYIDITGGSITATGEYYSDQTDSYNCYGISMTSSISKVKIGEGADEVIASGSTNAIMGEVINENPGKGWTNVEGTEGEEQISTSAAARGLKTQSGADFKKVQFYPVHKHKFKYEAGTGSDANKITATCEGKLDCPEGYKSGITIALNAPAELKYDGKDKKAEITGYPDTAVQNLADKPDIDYYKAASAGSTSVSGNKLEGAPKDAGNYVAKITWGEAEAAAAFTITRADSSVTKAPEANTIVYNGNDQELVTAGEASGGTMVYSLDKDSEFSTDIPTGNETGFYEVYYKVKGENNHNDSEVYGPIEVEITSPEVPLAMVTPKGTRSLVFSWTKVDGADGYDVFYSKCGKKSKYKKITVEGGDVTTVTKTKLAKTTGYKMYVRAWTMQDGTKTYISKTPVMHGYTRGYTKKYTDAKDLTLAASEVSLEAGGTYKIDAKVIKLKSSKKYMPKSHGPKLRYISNNEEIATVDSSGNVTAVKKGSCTIYVFTLNGITKELNVKVN